MIQHTEGERHCDRLWNVSLSAVCWSLDVEGEELDLRKKKKEYKSKE